MSIEKVDRIVRHNEEIFESKNELISQYQPKLIGVGNEHLVYSLEDHPNIVLKINKFSLEASIRWCLENQATADEFMADEDVRLAVTERINQYQQQLNTLTEHFGRTHVAKGRFIKIKIPLIPTLLGELGLKGDDLPAEAYAVAMVQERLDGVDDNESLQAWYPRSEEPDQFLEHTAIAVLNPSLTSTLHDIDVNSNIREFAETAIRYSSETERILDLAGAGNVSLYTNPDTGVQTYKIVDALFPVTWEKFIHEFKSDVQAYLNNPEDFSIEDRTSRIINTINYIRYINELAASTASNERLSVIPELTPEQSEKVKELIGKVHSTYRRRKNIT